MGKRKRKLPDVNGWTPALAKELEKRHAELRKDLDKLADYYINCGVIRRGADGGLEAWWEVRGRNRPFRSKAGIFDEHSDS